MKIYLDFDGTVVEHAYPRIGRDNFGCVEIIRRLQDAGHEIVLNTYRADCANGSLEAAGRLTAHIQRSRPGALVSPRASIKMQ